MLSGKARPYQRRARAHAKAAGFAYLLLLVTVATISLLSASSLSIGSQVSRRDAERELLAIGNEFEQALKSYAAISGNTGGLIRSAGPWTLQDLIKDPRFPGMKRHLRQIYADPLIGRSQWGLITDPGGSVIGIYSSAEGVPIQRTGFEITKLGFEYAESYADWVFGLPSASFPGNRRSASSNEAAQSGDNQIE